MIPTEVLGRYSATLTATEIGLGSILHSLHIPFSGNLLSLNQGFLLAKGIWRHEGESGARLLPARVSAVASILKSLSPAGKKLTPMLAIVSQGFLFSVGTVCFGTNLFGVLVGMFLLCLWPFVQPLLIYYFLFGRTLYDAALFALRAVQKYVPISDESLVRGFLGIVTVKLLVGLLLVWMSRRRSDNLTSAFSKMGETALQRSLKWSQTSLRLAARGAARELFRPFFIVNITLVWLFFRFSETPHARVIWLSLRPIAIGFVLYFAIRILPDRFLPRLARETLSQLRGNG